MATIQGLLCIRFSPGNVKYHRHNRFPSAHKLFICTSDTFSVSELAYWLIALNTLFNAEGCTPDAWLQHVDYNDKLPEKLYS
jgi:hypothetical protein